MGTLPMALFAPCTETRIPESEKFGTRKTVCWWKPKFWALEPGMQLKKSGIPLTNPESKFHTDWNPYLESGIQGVESRIQECL